MLLAVCRCFRLAKPVLYTSIFSETRSIIMAVSAWMLTIAAITIRFSSPLYQTRTSAIQPALCVEIFMETSAVIRDGVVKSLCITIPSLVVVVCYVKIYRTIRQHNTSIEISSSRWRTSPHGAGERKVTKTLTAVVVGFYICWFPYLLLTPWNRLMCLEKHRWNTTTFITGFLLLPSVLSIL